MNEKPKISVIVPVYDVAPYLKKCLNSIVCQTLHDIEIILVNDCSPDKSDDEICQKYAKDDGRIKYIKHDSNRKQGAARNTGIVAATGNYIWFVDSDDFIDINACEFLYSQITHINAEVLAFSAIDYEESPTRFRVKKAYHYHQRHAELLGRIYTGEEFINSALEKMCFYVTCWSHLFSREFISQFKFRENVFCEDTDFVPIAMRNARTVYCISYAPYYRLVRNNSVTQVVLSEDMLVYQFAYLDSLIQYANNQNYSIDDPLLKFASQQLQHIDTVYAEYRKKTARTEREYTSLLQLCKNSAITTR